MLRPLWMLFGPLGMLLLIGITADRHPPLPAVNDAAFAVLLIAVLGARFADVRWYRGTTSDGRLATMADVRAYVLKLGAPALALWALVAVLLRR